MERCPDCNAVMTKTEKKCGSCGTVVRRQRDFSGRAKFALLATAAFYGALGMTVASFFVPGLPSLSTCLPICVILLMIRSSATQMMDTTK